MNQPPDNINHPSHYTSGKIEVIRKIQDTLTPEEFRGYLHGNAIKYLLRYSLKGNPAEDLEKCKWYINRLKKEKEKTK